ncbi:MAG: S-layer protein [Candidatus Woesearchaeota archaeon]
MQIGKIAKKLAAVSTGALMLGATLTGALAASYKLADYPAPFIKNGVLDNTVIVVGKAAATADVVGAIDIAAALQAEAVSKTAVEVGAVAPTIDNGVKIERSGNKFNFDNDIQDVMDKLTRTNLDLLEQGTFKDTKGDNRGSQTYKQELQFYDGFGTLMLTQPKDMKGGVYLEMPKKSSTFYRYSLDFDTPNKLSTSNTADDLKGNSLVIQGKTYTISEVSFDSANKVQKMKLLAGDSSVWLTQDQPYTLGEHTITVVSVEDSSNPACGVNVDGVTKWIDPGTTEEFNGLKVGLLNAKAVRSKDYDRDVCELSLGSSEIVLEQGEPVEVNGYEIDGSSVSFLGNAYEFDGFTIDLKTNYMDKNMYLKDGQAWTDPVFGNWKVVYAGTTSKTETIKVESLGDKAVLTFYNRDGKKVEVPYYYDETAGAVFLGNDEDERLLLPGESHTYTGDYDVEGTLFLYSTPGGDVHLLQMTSLKCDSSSKNTTTIKDLTYGTTVAENVELANDCNNVAETIDMGSLGQLKVNVTPKYIYYDPAYGSGSRFTKYEGNFTFMNSTTAVFTEKAGDESQAGVLRYDLTYDNDDDEIKINVPTSLTWVNNDQGDSDTRWALLGTSGQRKGSIVKYDNKNKLSLEITYPEDDVYANVFVAPVDAEPVGGSAGGVTAEKVNPFSVGLAVLDTDAASMTKNMIVVGGPCANTVAAELLGNPTNCGEGFEPGKAMLKFFDRKGKAALLVAGYEAEETLNAAYVLAQHNTKYKADFAKLNDEVELVVADMSKVVFNTA